MSLRICRSLLSPVILLAFLSGCSTGSTQASGHGHKGGAPAASPALPGAREIQVEARSFSYSPAEIRVRAGESVNIAFTSVDTLHDFSAVGLYAHVAAAAGKTATGGFKAPDQPGQYDFYCTVPEHREAGMTGVVVVDPPA